MAKADALAQLTEKLGWGGADLNELKTILTNVLTQVYADIATGGGEVAAEDVSVEDTGESFTAEDVEAALAELITIIETYYQKPGEGIPSTDMAAAVQTSLGLADTAMQGGAEVTAVRIGAVSMNGTGTTPILFQAATAATVTSTNAETYDLTGVGDGGTIIINPDGEGNQTATINFAQGYHTGGDGMSTDISGGDDNKFKIAVDGDVDTETYHVITLTLVNCDSGANIAAEAQTQIQALTGVYAAVTVAFSTDHLVITSGTYGTGSKVRILRADDHNVTEELEIGPDGDSDTDGTGDVVNAAAATAAEIVDVMNADMDYLTASDASGSIKADSDTTGKDSSLVIGAGTLNTVLGFTEANEYYGGQGLGYDGDMADTNYIVTAVLEGVAQNSIAGKGLSINSKATDGFDLVCEDATSTDGVDLIIVGVPA